MDEKPPFDAMRWLLVAIALGSLAYVGYRLWWPQAEPLRPAAQATQQQQQTEETAMAQQYRRGSLCGEFDAASLEDPENTLLMEVSTGGCVVIKAFPEAAPGHVARFKELARQRFYDNVVFHRVIDGFMAQTGDPTGTGAGGSGVNLEAEFNDIPHTRGIVSTARAGDPDSADSQFFIMYEEKPHLDGQYTVWGEVIEGMEHIDQLKKGPAEDNGMVAPPRDYIVSLRVAADLMEDHGGEN